MKRIGIMGGTFNPIHIGHLLLAEWAKEEEGLNEVWLIPAGSPYMKSPEEILPGRERLHMAELGIRGNEAMKCLDMEIKREGPTYSYETLELLKEAYPEHSFYFIVGADCLFSIEDWKCPERIFESCILIAAVRDGTALKEMEKKKRELEEKFRDFHADIRLLPFLSMAVSSTEVRRRIREGKSTRYLVPDEVFTYIKEKGFYREESVQFKKA